MGMLRLYIGRVTSIYRACCIYISDASHLYIQRYPYIDAKGKGLRDGILCFAALNYFIMAKLSDRSIVSGRRA